MKTYYVYANNIHVDTIVVDGDYTLDDYIYDCKINGCEWEGKLEMVKQIEEE